MISLTLVQKIAVYAIPLIFAITFHETAHGYVAYRCGDDTAKMLGRLSLNPIKHVDPIGTVLLPLVSMALGGFIFGWARPVPLNFLKLHRIRRDVFLISIAGPLANFAMALIWALVLKYSGGLNAYFGVPLTLMAQAGIMINISLMILNLLPMLPLDGGRVVMSVLPTRAAIAYARTEPYGIWILLILLFAGGLTFIIQPLYTVVVNFILSLI